MKEVEWRSCLNLRKLSIRQKVGVLLLSALLTVGLVSVAFGSVATMDEVFWFFVALSASLLIPEPFTPHLLGLWGLFFGSLSLALVLGAPVAGVHIWGSVSGAFGFGVAALALFASAHVARRRLRARD